MGIQINAEKLVRHKLVSHGEKFTNDAVGCEASCSAPVLSTTADCGDFEWKEFLKVVGDLLTKKVSLTTKSKITPRMTLNVYQSQEIYAGECDHENHLAGTLIFSTLHIIRLAASNPFRKKKQTDVLWGCLNFTIVVK